MKAFPICVTALIFLGLAEAGPLDDLKLGLNLKLQEVQAPVTAFQTRYEEELGKLETTLQSQGNFNGLIQVQKEIATFRDADPSEPITYEKNPGLQTLRNLYVTNLTKLKKETAPKEKAVYETYLSRLDELKAQFTQEGNVQDALKVDNEQKRVKTQLASGSFPLATPELEGNVLWQLRAMRDVEIMSGCEVEQKKGGIFILTSPNNGKTGVLSDKSFKPPFRIVARVSTDSTNIRFHYGRGGALAIFNWEVQPHELRLHDPLTGAPMGFGGKGELTKNEMHDVDIRISTSRIEVYADGELRGARDGDFAKVDTPVGIGPCFGSVLTLERFAVLALE